MKDLVVIGQGYVGLPLSRAASNAGFKVTGLDVSQQIVDDLNSGTSHVEDIPDAELQGMLDRGYQATTNNSAIQEADVIVICVPTPLGDAGRPDLNAVESATQAIAENLTRKSLVVLESTTYPGTTEEILLPALEARGGQLDKDFFLAFSPERIDPGNKTYTLENTPKVVGGVSNQSGDLAVSFYGQFIEEVVKVKGAKEAPI